MLPIWFKFRCRVRFERLRRFSKGDNRNYAPMSPIELLSSFRVRLERLRRFPKGDNRDYAPMCSI